MLTIAKLGVGQENYYLSKVARGIEDYYSGDAERPGVWLGRGAARLGLVGEVSGAELRAVLGGVDPGSGQRLAGREGAKRVPGWDLTFSAPKSVSVLYALGGDEVAKEVVGAHEEAVADAVGYLERHATVSRRRVEGRIEQVQGEGLVVAAFRHRTSRAGDPQLHTHALVPNVVERIDGGTGALHSRVMYEHARTAGFVYQAVLRGGLTERLGVAWEAIHNGYAEIDGVDRRLIDGFSKRRAEIEAAMAERGEDSARAAQVAAHRTRSAKEYGVDPQTLAEQWQQEAARLGVDPASLGSALGRWVGAVSEHQLQAAIDDMVSPVGLTAHQATFDHRDVIRAWCSALPAGTKVTLDALEDLAEGVETDERVLAVAERARSDEVRGIVRADGRRTAPAVGRKSWTTTEMLDVEQRLLTASQASRTVPAGLVDNETVDALLAGRGDLSDEQAAMVRQLTTSGQPVEVVVGRAGSGKTYALAAAATVWRAGGYRPMGVGLAARAAHELETTAGIPSTTVARFLIDADNAPRGHLDQRDVIVVDEAAMVDTRRLARLVRHAELAGAKVVLVGDHHQLPAVEAGGAFAALVDRLGASELTQNRRQRERWERHTLDRLRTGAGGRAGIAELVETYGQHGRLHIGSTPAEVRAAMVADWYQARRRGAVAMVALRRSDVYELNCRARALLVADGTVDGHGLDVGDRTFAVGDRVVCLSNDRRLQVHNALFGHIEDVDTDNRTVVLRPEDGSAPRRLPYSYVAAHLDHAYATTINKAQGGTYDRTLLLGDDRLYRQAGYSALSRGRQRNDIYVVVDDDREHDPELESHGAIVADGPVERLIRVLHRDGAKLLATDQQGDTEVTAARPLRVLWTERDELAHRLGADAPDAGVWWRAGEQRDAVEVARVREQHAVGERTVAEEHVEGLRGFGRRRSRQVSEARLARLVAHEARLTELRQGLENRVATDTHEMRRAEQWAMTHRDELVRLERLDDAIARRARLAGHAAEIDRPAHVVAVLCDPPRELDGRARWRDVAGEIESYQARWGVTVDASADMALPDEQAWHLAAVRQTIQDLDHPAGLEVDGLS